MPSPARFREALAAPRPIHRAFLFGGGLLLLFLVVQLAGPSSEPPPEVDGTARYEAAPRSDGYRLFSVGNVLALALLAGGAAWAFHLRKRTAGAETAPSLFEPIGQMHLGQGQGLRLVRCGGEVLLLGVSSGQITLLHRYPDDAFDDVLGDAPPAAPPFADLLRAYAPGVHA